MDPFDAQEIPLPLRRDVDVAEYKLTAGDRRAIINSVYSFNSDQSFYPEEEGYSQSEFPSFWTVPIARRKYTKLSGWTWAL